MPSYVFEIATEQGAERFPFTLDHDRVLAPQVTQVLEELRQRGVVLKGGPDDELGVFWSGRELDQAQRAGELGISPARPLELRMRPRVATEPVVPADRSLPRGVLASVVLGYSGGVIAWIASWAWPDLTALVPTYARLDQLTLLLLGAITGAILLAAGALRRRGAVPLALVAGLVLGGVGAAGGGSLALLIPGATSLAGFMVARIVGWALAAGLASLFLACYAPVLRAPRLLESLAIGLVAGAAGGVIFALPGPSELWQAVAFTVTGAGMGMAVCGPALWRAAAVIDLVPARRRVPGILSLREWSLDEGRSVALGSASVACQQGRLAVYPAGGSVSVDAHAITEPAFLPAVATVGADGASYRVRESRGSL